MSRWDRKRGVIVASSTATKTRVSVPRGRQKGVFTLAAALTEEQIREVRARAVRHSDHNLMFVCDRALKGSQRSRVAVARFIIEGRAESR